MHRDLSPDNIILPGGKVERAKIIDFGIARSATIGGETLIGGNFAGKYNYVSPEQLGLFGGDVKERSDIYSLGLVLAAAMRGRPIDMGGSQMEVVEKRRTVPDLSDIDGAFRPMIEAMLQPDPADRPASMADIARMTRDELTRASYAAAIRSRPKASCSARDGNDLLSVEARPFSIRPEVRPTSCPTFRRRICRRHARWRRRPPRQRPPKAHHEVEASRLPRLLQRWSWRSARAHISAAF